MKILIVEGCVGAGKTSTINTLKQILGNREDVLFLREPKFTEHIIDKITYNPLQMLYEKDSDKNYYAIQQVIQQKLSAYYQTVSLQNIKLIIMDRWIPSCKIFSTLGFKNGLLTKFSYDVLNENIDRLQKKFLSKIKNHLKSSVSDLEIKLYYLNTRSKKCLENIKKRGRKEEITCADNFWLNLNDNFETIALQNLKKYHMIGNRDYILKDILSICKNEIGLNFPGRIEFEKCHEDAKLPECQTKDSVGYDLFSIENTFISPNGIQKIKTGIIIKHMIGHFYPQILSRSGLGIKKCTAICGTIDPDFLGQEIVVILLNYSEYPIQIKKGDRIAQLVFLNFTKPFSLTTTNINNKRTGGFGSTGDIPVEKKQKTKSIEPIETGITNSVITSIEPIKTMDKPKSSGPIKTKITNFFPKVSSYQEISNHQKVTAHQKNEKLSQTINISTQKPDNISMDKSRQEETSLEKESLTTNIGTKNSTNIIGMTENFNNEIK